MRNLLCITTRDELTRVDLSAVVYFEADGNYTKIISENGLISLVCMNLSNMQSAILSIPKKKSLHLARVGKRFIINMKHIYRISVVRQEIVLSDQKTFSYTLNISKEALKKLKEIVVKSSDN